MSTFALFYKPADITAIAAWATATNLTNAERQYANRLWNAGLSNWNNAPQAKQDETEACVIIPFEPIPGQIDPDKTWSQLPDGRWLVCDPTMKRLVISGSQVSKQQTIDWLRLIGQNHADAVYMLAIADDIVQTAVEPYVP
jgi:hypothetical protein